MKQKIWIVVVVVVLSILASSLTGCGIETGIEIGADTDAITTATQPPAESGDDQVPRPPKIAEGQIPEGYPEKEIPIYEPASSVILGGLKQDMGDALFYNLVIGSNDDVQTVIQNIRNEFENKSTEFEDIGGGMLIGIKGEWEYTITINPGEADGYETLITCTLIKEQ